MIREPTRPTDVPDNLLPGALDEYVVADVFTCSASDDVASVWARLRGHAFATVDDIAVCATASDGSRRLVGLIPIERLCAAADGRLAGELIDPDPAVVIGDTAHEQAAWKAVRHGESSLAVVDSGGGLRGLIPPSRLLTGLLRGHDRDMARLGGYLSSTESARHASMEPLRQRLLHRLPWLLVGLLGSAVATGVVGGFEDRLATDIRLAFFVPGLVYMADAVGTQTETLVIRGMSVGASIRQVFRLEALTGILIGVLLATISYPLVWWVFGSAELALTVCLALLAACGVATVVAMSLPWAMARTGRDPAFGSGPLATVVQDLLTLAIYFGIAVLVFG